MSHNIEDIERKIKAPTREVPEDWQEMILQTWYALIGTNGQGLLKQFEEFKKNAVTKEACNAYHENTDRRRRNIERVFSGLFVVLGFLFGDNILSCVMEFFSK